MLLLYHNYTNIIYVYYLRLKYIPVVPKTKHKHNVNQELVAFMVLFDDDEITTAKYNALGINYYIVYYNM